AGREILVGRGAADVQRGRLLDDDLARVQLYVAAGVLQNAVEDDPVGKHRKMLRRRQTFALYRLIRQMPLRQADFLGVDAQPVVTIVDDFPIERAGGQRGFGCHILRSISDKSWSAGWRAP